MKKIIQFLVPVLLAASLIGLIFYFYNPVTLWNEMKQANFGVILIALIIALMAHLSRALRWVLLLKTLDLNAKPLHAFLAVMTAYFGNIFIPRGGEVMRCVVLNRSDNIPFNSGFATVVAERVFDFICLLSLIGVSLILEFDRFMLLFNDPVFAKKEEGPSLTMIILGVGAISLLFSWIFRKKLRKISVIDKILGFVFSTFSQAFKVFLNMKHKGQFVAHTIFIWVCYYLMTYLIFFSLPFTSHLGMQAGLVILIVGGLGMSAPSAGGFGTFHFMVAAGLTLFYGLNKDHGMAYAAVLHTSQFLMMLVIGGICTFFSYYVIGGKRNDKNEIKVENVGS